VARAPAQATPAREPVAAPAWSGAAVATVIDYLRGTPVHINGVIGFENRLPLYSGSVMGIPVGIRVNPNTGIGVEGTEENLSVYTGAGLFLTIAGLPVRSKRS
jgi:hypothetical protein